jgi:hypothetical protein
MKLSKLHFSSLAVLALAISVTSSAKAVLTYTSDDLFLGFHQTGNTTRDYVINLGQASIFRDATAPFALSTLGITTSAFAADMLFAFGANWRTSGDIFWGVVGTTQNDNTRPAPDNIIRLLYVSEPLGTTPIASPGQSGPANLVNTFKNIWINPTANGGVERTVPNSATEDPTLANSWTGSLANANGPFGSGNLSPLEDLLANPLDVFRVPQTGTGQPVTNEGRFSINFATDVITFTPVVVPEPSSVSLICIATLGSFGLRRLRRRMVGA